MMSAMSASPVKPVLPPTGVNVTPPVVTSPPKIGIPIPPTLTISPAKPATMNHAPMPMGMPDHKMPQFPPQPQAGIPAMQPMMPQLPPRTPEKPKDLSAPAVLPMKPTSNGMEGLAFPNQPHMPMSTLAESQVTPSAAHSTKVENQSAEMPESNAIQTQPTAVNANSAEPSVAAAAPPTEPEPEKKEEHMTAKPAEPASEASVPSVPATPEVASTTPSGAVTGVPPVSGPVSSAAPTPAATAMAVPPAASTPAAVPASTPAAGTVAFTSTRVPASKQPTPPPEPACPPPPPPVVTPSVSRTEALTHSKPDIKVATIPRQATKRKRDSKVVPATPEVKKEGKDDDRKSKRVRLPTQPYQSPLPELNIIAKISKSTKSTPSKAADDKLIVFYKNEFLAVRNAEGGFYVCQTMQNIYKSSSRIRIRWLSQEDGKDTYSPDFYDHTDFDCILTNLNLDKVEKEKFKLPQEEQQRTESILKRALDVEKGVSEKPPITEEHPDGLDLSLYRDESQLKKSKKGRSRKKTKGKKTNSSKSDGADSESEEEDDDDDDDDDDVDDDDDDDDDDEEEDEEDEKKAKTESAPKTSKRKKKTAKKKAPPPVERRSAAKTTTSANKSSVTPAKKKSETRVGSKRKAAVSTNSQSVEKRARKADSSSQSSERTNKTRSAEAAAGAKSRRDRRSKSRK